MALRKLLEKNDLEEVNDHSLLRITWLTRDLIGTKKARDQGASDVEKEAEVGSAVEPNRSEIPISYFGFVEAKSNKTKFEKLPPESRTTTVT